MEEQIRLLAVDDNPMHAPAIAAWVNRLNGVGLQFVTSLNELAVLEQTATAVLFSLNTSGGGCPDYELLRALQETRALPFVCYAEHVHPLSRIFSPYHERLLFIQQEKVEFELGSVIEAVAAGKGWKEICKEGLVFGPGSPVEEMIYRLSPRETEVVCLMGKGHGAPETAEAIGCSTGTVETHIKNIRAKLGLSGSQALRYQAINYARSCRCAAFSLFEDHMCRNCGASVGKCPLLS